MNNLMKLFYVGFILLFLSCASQEINLNSPIDHTLGSYPVEEYQLDIAVEVQKEWFFSFNKNESKKDIYALVEFKVMPDGTIRDIRFVEESENERFNQSAYKAVIDSSPVKAHPENFNEKYVRVGIRFSSLNKNMK